MRHVTVQQLSAFLDGALAGVSRELVTRHLAACADCRERHALWHIYDEVLQRVLSWEPNERTMEEASARVELTLTAERRGLPPPEFTSVLHPVIASTPDPAAAARASGVFPALPPDPALPAATPRPAAAAPTPAPPPRPAPPAPAASAPPPVAMPAATPSVLAFPLDTAAAAPATAPPTPAPWLETGPTRPIPVSPPGHGYTRPIGVHEDLRPHPEPSGVPWASVPLPEPRRRRGRVLITALALLALVVLATPWLPDVIRIRVPDTWEPRVPRVEFVRHDVPPPAEPAHLDPTLRLAERTSSEPPLVPYRALPAPVESVAARPEAAGAPAAASAPTRAAIEAASPEPPAVVTPPTAAPKPRAPARSPRPARPRPAPAQAARAEEDESGTAAGVEHSMTFVPVQVKTEVQLSPAQPPPAGQPAPPAPATAADTAGDEALPLLCGEVLDESGGPIEGARIQVMSPALTLRTDKRGRFCVALPAGERTFLVEAPGYAAVTRGVELSGPTFETHVTLAATR